jgi:hypothetical protein
VRDILIFLQAHGGPLPSRAKSSGSTGT